MDPVTPARWDDLTTLFGPRGAVGGCWCMWNLQTQREFDAMRGDRNRESLRARVESGPPPGLLAYRNGEPVGWISLGPRETYGRIERSRVTKRVDDAPVWSIVCFFIPARHRRQGVGAALLVAAAEFARGRGVECLEAYPTEPRSRDMPGVYAWMGVAAMFRDAGYQEVARRSPTRPIMRKELA